MNLTPMVRTLLIVEAVCTVVFMFIANVAPDTAALLNHFLALTPSLTIRGFVWQPLTYLFMHAGAMHLLLNMLMLWLLGMQLEARWGSKSFLRFFLISGVGSGLAVVLTGLAIPYFNAPTVGMSGATNALLMALVLANPEATFNFYFVLPIKAKHLIWIIVLIEVLMALSGSSASFPAHMGGLAMGYLLVTGKWRPSRWGFLKGRGVGKKLSLKGRAGNLRIVRPDDDDDEDDDHKTPKYLN
jgi:membrane associated rhomboid family serine protease